MNIRLITRTVGYILWVEGGFLLLPLLVSLGYGDGCWEAFLSAALLCGILGALAYLVPVKRGRMQGRDAYAAVALARSLTCCPIPFRPLWTHYSRPLPV